MEGLTIAVWLGEKVFGAAFSAGVKSVLRKRLEPAREILIQELEKGDAALSEVEDLDEAAAMVFDYADAARKGVARRNLRLLAQLIAGQIQNPPVYPDTFLEFSRVLSELTMQEMSVLVTYCEAFERVGPDFPITRAFGEAREHLVSKGICSDADDYLSVLQALGRTGLIAERAPHYNVVTPKCKRLMELVSFEEALKEPKR